MRIFSLSIALTVVIPLAAYGVDEVPIVKHGATKSAIDLSGFGQEGGGATVIFRKTLEEDLKRSGWFTITGQGGGALVLRGSCVESGGSLTIECRVSTIAGKGYLNKTFKGENKTARELAHKVADEIVWAVKRVRGIASTRIVMIGFRDGKKDIYLCDVDGRNFLQITKDGAVCLAPEWGPDAGKVVYTSFLGGFPDVYMLTFGPDGREQVERGKIASYPGLNMGADISPDGRSMVLTLSKDGNPDLYVMNLRNKRLTRITRTRYAAEASPSWSPDGKQIVFVSDKSGSPHLYIIGRSGGEQKRITYRGNENVSPDWGPDGRIAFSSRRKGRYHICIIVPGTRDEKQLTSEYVDHEDPSWAPDGRHIAYTRTQGYQSAVYVLDTMGDPQVRFTSLRGQWYSPAWSPK